MSNKQQEAKAIHPEVLKKFPLKSILALLEVARDLRSGKISREEFDMMDYWSPCGTAHCIGGWALIKLGHTRFSSTKFNLAFPVGPADLFSCRHPSDPQLAVDAIERYVYEHHPDPWLWRVPETA